MLTQLQVLKGKQKGLTSVEYAVAGGLVVAAIVAAMVIFGPALSAAFQAMVDAM